MDYSVRDSSIMPELGTLKVYNEHDANIRVGIVREERAMPDESTRYVVEVAYRGKQVPISCVLLSRWGGAHNYEEYRIRPWVKKFPANALLPASASTYDLRSGDVVVVAFLDGQSREGVILGGLRHNSRIEKTTPGNLEYISNFNGLETQIRNDGSYKITFKGKPINDKLLDTPPNGTPVPEPQYNPQIAGSFFGFDADGSYLVSDGKQYMKMKKDVTGGSTVFQSGKNRIDMSGTVAQGKMGLKTDNFTLDSMQTSIKAKTKLNMAGLQVSIKGTQVAIGSDQFELFDGLDKLITALGGLVIMSPVGTCTPFQAAPTWASDVLPLQMKLKALIAGIQDPEEFEETDVGGTELANDIGG